MTIVFDKGRAERERPAMARWSLRLVAPPVKWRARERALSEVAGGCVFLENAGHRAKFLAL